MRKVFYFLFLISFYPALGQNVALNFDGVNDYVQTSYPGITGTGARTVEAWIKTTANCNPSAGGAQNVICDWGTAVVGSRFTFNVLYGNAIRIEVNGSGLNGQTPVNDGQWHHVSVVYSSTAALPYSLYVDGLLDTAGSIPTAISTTAGNMVIGRRVDAVKYFAGNIDEVRVYNVALSQSQIQADMNKEFCALPANLTAYYKLNEGTANGTNTSNTTARDYSGNNHNGTLNGFALTGSTSNWTAGPTLTGGSTSANSTVFNCLSYTSPSGHHTWVQTGLYHDTIPNASGCDSVITINLTIGGSHTTTTAHSCDTFISPKGTHITQSGTYSDTFTTSHGCDSIITTTVTIGTGRYAVVASSCDSFITIAHRVYRQTGIYTDTIPNHNTSGCDSIITTNLSIFHAVITNPSMVACDSAFINGRWYASSQSIIMHGTTVHGCDSIATISLTVTAISRSVTQVANTLTAHQHGATYKWINCATNLVVAGATDSVYTATANGSYAATISLNGCTDTSACFTVSGLSIQEPETHESISIIPNPSRGSFVLQTSGYVDTQYFIADMLGHLVLQQSIKSDNEIINLSDMAEGIYTMSVKGALPIKFVVLK